MRSQAPREATDAYASGEMVGVIPLSQLKRSSDFYMTRVNRRLNEDLRKCARRSNTRWTYVQPVLYNTSYPSSMHPSWSQL